MRHGSGRSGQRGMPSTAIVPAGRIHLGRGARVDEPGAVAGGKSLVARPQSNDFR